MGISSTLVIFSFILLVYNVQENHAQTCTFQCISPTAYVSCTAEGKPDFASTTGGICTANPVCHGSTTNTDAAAGLCIANPCVAGAGINHGVIITTGKKPFYYTCNNIGDVFPILCTNGIFNTTTGNCDIPVVTTTAPTTDAPGTTAGPTPPTCIRNAKIVDPTSCNHYYACKGSTTARRTRCPFRMRFNTEKARCGVWYFTTCGSRPIVN